MAARHCLRCRIDLDAAGEIGIVAFLRMPPPREVMATSARLCLGCGGNGRNTFTRDAYVALVAEGPVRAPAPRPCATCPYRRDVPAGLWAAGEYSRLPAYDGPTGEQPAAMFLCHDGDGRLCAGWLGCHNRAAGSHALLALRVAAVIGRLDRAALAAAAAYRSPVPLFESGRAAAAHGLAGIERPDARARAIIARFAAQGRPTA